MTVVAQTDTAFAGSCSLSITLFGPMETRVENRPLPPVRSRKIGYLLALLVLRHGKPVAREWLAGTLWPDADQTQAFANLRPALSQLRTALGAQEYRVQSPSRHTLLFDLTDGTSVDVLAFDAGVASKQLDKVERAVALYRGPLLEGCSEEWVFQERDTREQAFINALQTLAGAALRETNDAKAIGYLRRLVHADPVSDTAHRSLMEALARNGDRNAALELYREFAERLRRDKTMAPHEETAALYRRLRQEARKGEAQGPPAAAQSTAAAINLPAAPSALIGREDECRDIALQLRRARLVTLLGPGGVGKTRLAVRAASDLTEEFTDGILFVGLEALPARPFETDGVALTQIVQQIASVVGVKELPGQPLLPVLIENLCRKHLLLIVDNCEHVVAACALVAGRLLRDCSQIRLLTTSREPLRIPSESVYPVPPLAAPPEPDCLPAVGGDALARALAGYDSVALFVQRAQAARASFILNRDNAAFVADVCRQLEGVPLAIELAAARVRAMGMEQIAERLRDHKAGPLSLLTGGNRTAQTRQQTLRAVLDWSYSLLSPREKLVFEWLSVFSGGWTLSAAEAVCVGDGLEAAHVLDLLTALVDKSLIQFADDAEAKAGRYRFLETVRQYASERLGASGDLMRVRENHSRWVLRFAEGAEPDLRGLKQEHALRCLDAEYDNLRAALAWSFAEDAGKEARAEAGLRLVGALSRFWFVRGYTDEGRNYFAQALAQTKEAGRGRAKALNGAAELAYLQNDYDAAQQHYQNALSLAESIGDARQTAQATKGLGDTAFRQKDRARARSCYEKILPMWRGVSDDSGTAQSLYGLANTVYEDGDFARAQTLYEESLAFTRACGDNGFAAWVLTGLGKAARMRRDYAAARAFYEESVHIFQETGDKRGEGVALSALGNAVADGGDAAFAQTILGRSVDVARAVGDKRVLTWALITLGSISHEVNDYAAARAQLDEGIFSAQAAGDERAKMVALLYRAELARDENAADGAQADIRECLRLARALRDPLVASLGLMQAAYVLFAKGEAEPSVVVGGAASALRDYLAAPMVPYSQTKHDAWTIQARAAIGADDFDAAWHSGRALTWEQAADLVIETK